MGFSGGSSNVTKAHQHDSTVVQDGGALAANATQFGLTNGSLLYSDGTNIQEIGIGASGDVLGTATGTIPTWESAAAPTSAWTQVFSDTLTGDSNDWENTFTGIDQDDYAMYCLNVFAGFDDDSDILMRLHDSSGEISSRYYNDGIKTQVGAATYTQQASTSEAMIGQHGNRKNMICTVWMTMGHSTFVDTEMQNMAWSSTCGVLQASSRFGGCTFTAAGFTSLHGITLYADAVGGVRTFEVGSKATLWKIL